MGVENTEGYKKRILFVGESSFLNTGFSTYYRELLPRLVATGKYEIAEFGSYAADDNPEVKAFIKGRWKFYGNNPMNPQEQEAFNQPDPSQPGQNTNQFGRYKFDAVLADFRPDIVIDIRDWWMIAFQERSPFRKYFSWLVMPTVDSIPQREEWISTYNSATYVMAYSDFGIDSLRKSSPRLELRSDPPGKPGFIGIDKMPGKLHPVPLRPGVDLKTFHPYSDVEKGELKSKWGIKPDIPIVLLVQRNQGRKRISEVMAAFAMMKNKYPDNDVVQKSILVMHTAWPDNALSIDFPRAIARIQTGYHGCPVKRKGIIREINSTFMCHNTACGDVFIAPSINLRQHHVITCPKCGQQSARTPTTGAGITREQLAEVFGMADMMVQMSIAEGCFAKNTLVTTDQGLKPIEQMQIGDMVLNHQGGWAPVNDVWENDNPGCVEVTIHGDPTSVIATRNHEIYISPTEKKQADELTSSDYVVRPIDTTEIHRDQLIFGLEDEDNIMIGDKMHHKSKRYFNGYPTNTTIAAIDLAKHAYFCGVYTAEGSIIDHYISIAISQYDNPEMAQSVYDVASDLGVKVYDRQKGDNGRELTFSSHAFSNKLGELFGKNTKDKKIPIEFMQASLDIQKEFVGGWFDGDGTLESHNKEKVNNAPPSRRSLTTHTQTLAYQWRDLLARQGVVTYLYKAKRNNLEYIAKIFGHQSFLFDSLVASHKAQNSGYQPLGPARKTSKIKIEGDYLYYQVKDVKDSDYNDFVYNLTIDRPSQDSDIASSYCLGTLAVKNCGMPVQEAKACGTPVLVTDYAAIAEKGEMPDYDHIDKANYTVHKGGEKMDVAYLYEEPETTCWRAMTSMEDCADKMAAMLGDSERLKQMSLDARQCAEDNYDWEKNWRPWEFILDHITPLDRDTTWDKDVELIEIDTQQPPANCTDDEFIIWCYTKLLGYRGENDIDEEGRRNWLQKLAVEASRGVSGDKTRDEIAGYFRQQGEAQNAVERLRGGKKKVPTTSTENEEDVFEAMIL